MSHSYLMLLCLSAALCIAGCGGTDVKEYVPGDEAARQALTAALDAWKSGKAPDQVGAVNPAVNPQDKQWTDGAKLSAYEIVGPAGGEDNARRFTVRLTLEGAAPKETSYFVVGKDPLWVFSEESYQRLSGM